MSLLTAIAAQLQAWDEAALLALGNRGLLRRAQKDLASTHPQRISDTDDALCIGYGQHRIVFDSSNVAQARCSCPATGVCQHVLAVLLWLQQQHGDTDTASAAASIDCEAQQQRLHDDLMAISTDALRRHAGRTGYQWARQFVLDLQPDTDVRIACGRNISIGFARPAVSFHYMGGGVDALIADTSIAALPRYQVAAVLAYRLAQGVLPEALPEAKRKAAGRDLAGEHGTSAEARGASRQRLYAAINSLLKQCISLGLTHLSAHVQQRFATLSVWAQGSNCYRLARLLRRIADHIEQLLRRTAAANEQRLLDELALAHALVCALQAASVRGDAPAHLLGRARHRYEHAGQLQLLLLGAWPWQAASGYQGLSLLLYDPTLAQFLSCTDARPLGQGFNARARFTQPWPWPGMGSPSSAHGQRICLQAAQIGADARLSLNPSTYASTQPISTTELRQQLTSINDWQQLQAHSGSTQSLLAEPAALAQWRVLKPGRFGDAHFDAITQQLHWPLFDTNGQCLTARLPFSPDNAHAIEQLDGLQGQGMAADTLLIARISRTADGLMAEPLSLLSSGADATLVCLHFHQLKRSSSISQRLSQTINAAIGRWQDSADTQLIQPPNHALPSALTRLRDVLLANAERGLSDAATCQQARSQLSAISEHLKQHGFNTFPSVPSQDTQLPSYLLRCQYLVLQHIQLLEAGLASADQP